MRHVVAGTAGHIDHGKSALVKALTGTDPDRLMEEKLRGITIDLGFAHLNLGDLQIGFVDVPGHEKFVKNMLAGVGGIDFVLLVVAADESVMPQTREHFDICRLLGIRSGILVITKADAVDPELIELVRDELRDMTRGSFLEHAPVVAVSSKTGAGIEGLKKELRELARSIPVRSEDRKLRLPVDRAFSVRGFGTVVTGTLTSGTLVKDSEVELIPGSIIARVRGIQVHGESCPLAVAGQRTAVNLQGIDLAQVGRGMVLTDPRNFASTQIADVKLNLLPTARPLKNLLKVRFHQGTAEVLARVALLGRETLEPGTSAYAQLRLDAPSFCLHGDAFIIRQFSPTLTIGGGKILNPRPVKHKITDKSVLALLERLDHGNPETVVHSLVSAQPKRAVDLRELNSMLGMPEDELKTICDRLAGSQRLLHVPAPVPLFLLPEIARTLEEKTLSLVREFHVQNPLQKGVSREEVRTRVFDDLPQEIFRYLLQRLAERRKIALQEEAVCLYGHEIQLSPHEEALRVMIESYYRESGCQPAPASDLPDMLRQDAAEVRKVYFWMLKERILIKVSDELTWHHRAIDEIKNKIRSAFKPGDKFGVAEFKDLVGMTRKHAIPMLEYLDRERVTRRQGNDRIIL